MTQIKRGNVKNAEAMIKRNKYLEPEIEGNSMPSLIASNHFKQSLKDKCVGINLTTP